MKSLKYVKKGKEINNALSRLFLLFFLQMLVKLQSVIKVLASGF